VWVNTAPSNGVEPSVDIESSFWARVTLSKIEKYNHDSFIFTFTVDDYNILDRMLTDDKKKFKKLYKSRAKLNKKLLANPIECWHIDLQDGAGLVIREYTPISTWNELKETSKMDLLIKLYPDGKMSQSLAAAQHGAKFFMGPPKRTISSSFFLGIPDDINYACIAGGTGITPFLQMIQFIETRLQSKEKAPKLTLLYSNKKVQDVLLKDKLLSLSQWGDHFKVIFTLTREDPTSFEESHGYLFGRVSGDFIQKFLPPTTHHHVFVSGPEGMWSTLFPILMENGYAQKSCTELEA